MRVTADDVHKGVLRLLRLLRVLRVLRFLRVLRVFWAPQHAVSTSVGGNGGVFWT